MFKTPRRLGAFLDHYTFFKAAEELIHDGYVANTNFSTLTPCNCQPITFKNLYRSGLWSSQQDEWLSKLVW